jgi:hypothetical protein
MAISLSYSELYNYEFRVIDGIDEYNNIKLSLSAFGSLKKGIIPIHIADNILCNLGYPVHQFYSPLPYIIIALFSFVNGNIYTGFAITVILFITIAFIYAFKLTKYLFKDDLYGLTGGFIYICAPYISIVRAIRSAYPEFFAICLLPMFLYFTIRCINKFSIKNLTYSIVVLSMLFLTYLITSFYLLLFCFIFLVINIIINTIKTIKDKKINRMSRLLNKTKVLFIILICALLLNSWYLCPIIFYKNLFIKNLLEANDLSLWKDWTNIFSLFSISDVSPDLLDKIGIFKLQTGFIFNLSLLLIILIRKKNISNYITSLIITQLIILVIIIYPFEKGSPIGRLFSLVQFTYRFISFYNLAGTILIIAVLKFIINFIASKNRYAIKIYLSGLIILYGIITSSFYQRNYREINNETLFGLFDSKNIYEIDSFYSTINYEYLLDLSAFNDIIPQVDNNFLVKKHDNSELNKKIFGFNINNYSIKENYNGYIDLEILYYPQLQNIFISIDNKNYKEVKLSFNRKNIYMQNPFGRQILSIYGLRISNLPEKGEIFVEIQFRGYFIANMLSLATLAFYILFLTLISIRKRARYKKIIR